MPNACKTLSELKGYTRPKDKRPSASQRGYGSRWNRARVQFLKENPLCVECLKRGQVTAATVVDHEIPHKGDTELFWDKSNWRSLCTPDHNAKSAKEKR
jgi:5-methylcytosine-specific restriction protein A